MKLAFLVEVEVDEVEHASLNAKRRAASTQTRTPSEEVTFTFYDALNHKFVKDVKVAPATQA